MAILPETLFLTSVCVPFPDNLGNFRSYDPLLPVLDDRWFPYSPG